MVIQNRTHYPVLNKRQTKHFPVSENFWRFFEWNLREWRVHHHDEANCNRNRRGAYAEAIQEWHHARNEPPESDA